VVDSGAPIPALSAARGGPCRRRGHLYRAPAMAPVGKTERKKEGETAAGRTRVRVRGARREQLIKGRRVRP
jgi:hypothetical protein